MTPPLRLLEEGIPEVEVSGALDSIVDVIVDIAEVLGEVEKLVCVVVEVPADEVKNIVDIVVEAWVSLPAGPTIIEISTLPMALIEVVRATVFPIGVVELMDAAAPTTLKSDMLATGDLHWHRSCKPRW